MCGMAFLPRMRVDKSEEEAEEEPVTPAGRAFIQPEFYCTALCVLGFKQPVDVEALKSELMNTLVKHKRFCSVMRKNGKGKEVWVRTEVNIGDHVLQPRFDEHQLDSDTLVEDYAAELGHYHLDISKPLWEVHVINSSKFPSNIKDTDSRARGVCIFVFHHSLGDGISLMSLLLASTRRLDDPNSLPSVPSLWKTSKLKLPWRQAVWRAVLRAWYSLTEILNFIIMQVWTNDSLTSLKGHRGSEVGPSHLSILHWSLDELKRVKNATRGSTINDVLLAVISMAIRRYLRVKEGRSHASIEKLRVRALTMVNTRASPGLQELAEMMKSSGTSNARWGNSLGLMLIPLTLTELEDPLDYVRHAKSISTKKKLSLEPHFTYNSGALILRALGPKVAAKLTYKSTLHTTMTMSNIVGPCEAVSLAGNPLVYIVPTSSGLPQGLVLHMTSYTGRVSLALMVNKKIVQDPASLSSCFDYALRELLVKSSKNPR